MKKVLIAEKVSSELINLLSSNGFYVKFGSGTDEASVLSDIQGCDAVVVRLLKITRKIIDNTPSLKIIAKHGVGCDSIDLEAAKEHGIPVIFAPGSNSYSVAEHTIMLMLSCAKKLKLCSKEYSNGNFFVKDLTTISEISGKTLGLVGFGKIARYVADIAKNGFNMKIVYYDPFVNRQAVPDCYFPTETIDQLLATSDFVSLHIPGIKENHHLINSGLLCKMKKTAVLINTSRGSIVDTEALINAVDSGVIAGAGLDVTDPEPLDPQSPLFSNPNIIVTPHCGAASYESMVRMGQAVFEGLKDFFDGTTPKNIFNS